MKSNLAPEADQVGTVMAARSAEAACGVDPCSFCEARPCSVCKAVPEADLALLADAATVVKLGKGEVLVREDDPADSLFNVTAGALKIYKLLPDGRRQVLGFLFTGDFLGVGRRDRYGFTAAGLTPVRLCRFPRRKFLQRRSAVTALVKRAGRALRRWQQARQGRRGARRPIRRDGCGPVGAGR